MTAIAMNKDGVLSMKDFMTALLKVEDKDDLVSIKTFAHDIIQSERTIAARMNLQQELTAAGVRRRRLENNSTYVMMKHAHNKSKFLTTRQQLKGGGVMYSCTGPSTSTSATTATGGNDSGNGSSPCTVVQQTQNQDDTIEIIFNKRSNNYRTCKKPSLLVSSEGPETSPSSISATLSPTSTFPPTSPAKSSSPTADSAAEEAGRLKTPDLPAHRRRSIATHTPVNSRVSSSPSLLNHSPSLSHLSSPSNSGKPAPMKTLFRSKSSNHLTSTPTTAKSPLNHSRLEFLPQNHKIMPEIQHVGSTDKNIDKFDSLVETSEETEPDPQHTPQNGTYPSETLKKVKSSSDIRQRLMKSHSIGLI